MKNKKQWMLTGGALALAALAAVLMLGKTPQTIPQESTQTRPQAPAPSLNDQTLPPETVVPGTSAPETLPPQETTEATQPIQTEPEEDDRPTVTLPPETEPDFFPMELENGKLLAESLFTFSGMNPDADDLFGEDLAGLQLSNTSDEFLRRGEFTAILTDGTTLTFLVEDLPAGKSVMAFALEHEPVADPVCGELFGTAEFEAGDPLRTDLVKITVEGTEITVKNVSGKNLTNLHVYCHGLLDTSYFGGSTYHYTLESLQAGKSAVIHAQECFLGIVEVVRVQQGN